MLVARKLGRNCIGYELDLELREAIEKRLGLKYKPLVESNVEVIIREDAKKLRTTLREAIEEKLRENNK